MRKEDADMIEHMLGDDDENDSCAE